VNLSSLATVLVAVHVLANVVWIGALLSVTLIVARAGATKFPVEAWGLARYVHVRLAVPAFLVSFVAGVSRILLAPSVYAHAPWFHAKLTFALVVIVLHHVIGARTKRAAAGTADSARGVPLLGAFVFAAAAGAVFFAIARSLP
jgi:putative membrane protein